jgi:hypothetical protein
MIVVKKITKNEDGGYTAQWALDADQMSFLLTYSINDLLRNGLLTVDEQNGEEPDEKQMQLDFLKEIPVEVLGKTQ